MQNETITIDAVHANDFGVYTCSAESFINGENIARTFNIELMERGWWSIQSFEMYKVGNIGVKGWWRCSKNPTKIYLQKG